MTRKTARRVCFSPLHHEPAKGVAPQDVAKSVLHLIALTHTAERVVLCKRCLGCVGEDMNPVECNTL